jgi:hypothetical protein
MSSNLQNSGFAPVAERVLVNERRGLVLAELATIGGLVASTLVAATVITMGVARAAVADGVIDNEGGLFAIALGLGLLFIAVGGFSLFPSRAQRHRH